MFSPWGWTRSRPGCGSRASPQPYTIMFWAPLAAEAAAEYRNGRAQTIILVGHSSGATVLPDMVARLDRLGVPVSSAIGLDSVFRTGLSGTRRALRQFLHRQWRRHAGREDKPVPGRAGECRRAKHTRYRAHHDREERDHPAEGDQPKSTASSSGRHRRKAAAAGEQARQSPGTKRRRHATDALLPFLAAAHGHASNSANSSAIDDVGASGPRRRLEVRRSGAETASPAAHANPRRLLRVIGPLLPPRMVGQLQSALAGPPAGRPMRRAAAPASAGRDRAAGARLLFRGALGPIFSRGMDRLTKRIEARRCPGRCLRVHHLRLSPQGDPRIP